jgi:thiol-disulfide isomerase/thioredoxin
MMRSLVRLLPAVTAIALAAASPAPAGAAGNVPLAVGATAPALVEPTASGTFDSTKSTKPYVIEFFAVWCPHCQRETVALNRLQDADGARIDVIAVPASPFGFDKSSVLQPAELQTFAQRFDTHYRIGFDGLFSSSYDYGVPSFPTFFFVGADRHIVAVESGEIPFEKLHADVNATLGTP